MTKNAINTAITFCLAILAGIAIVGLYVTHIPTMPN